MRLTKQCSRPTRSSCVEETGDSLFVVVQGRIRIEIGGHHVEDMGPGSVVGELAVLVSEPRSATTTAIDECLLLRLRKAVFDELLLDYPEVARGVITALVRRFRERDFGVGSDSSDTGTL